MKRVPFYSWIRLGVLCWLVLPQTQGARIIYQDHIHPFLAHHEQQIEVFIGRSHQQARKVGLDYLKKLIDFVKLKAFGIEPQRDPTPPPTAAGYAQSLLSRFNLPGARQGLAAPAGDIYGFLSAALSQTSAGGSREQQAEELSASGSLYPKEMSSDAERLRYIASQRERLGVLMSALDKQARSLPNDGGVEADIERRMREMGAADEGLKKSKSEAEFEAIDPHDITPEKQGSKGWFSSGGWGAQALGLVQKELDKGSSSSYDPHLGYGK